ncbi:MAG: pyridoxamine 5'-phosphate oxidase family protein [bacterium]
MKVPALNEKDLKDLLAQPLVAKIATVSSKGDARITPIWFGDEGGSILTNTFEDSGLVRNLRNNPKCSLMIDSPDWPYIGVHYWGTAIVEGPENDVEGIAKLFAPYRGGLDEAREYAKGLIGWGTRVYVRFTPQRKTTWDFRQ